MRVGDDIDRQFPKYRSALINKRQLLVELEVLNRSETGLFVLRYERLHRVAFDFPTADPWYLRFADRGCNPIDDWIADEVAAVDDNVLRYEILFSSGATLLLDFETMSVRSTVVEGRTGLVYVDDEAESEVVKDTCGLGGDT